MSEKQRWQRGQATFYAEQIVQFLEPFCERIEIAGSIRREKETVGDIEILYIPKMEEVQSDLFGTEPHDIAGERIDRWLCQGILEKRKGMDGRTVWGSKNKLAIYQPGGIPVDFFATTAENWWVSLVIRTGGKETNLKLTSAAIARGMHLNAYGSGFTLQNKQVIHATSELDVFDIAGVPYQEPKHRA